MLGFSLAGLLLWLSLGLLLGLWEWPYQLLSELGFDLQRRLWPGPTPLGVALVFVGSLVMLRLAWGPLARGRGGGLTPVMAAQLEPGQPPVQQGLALRTQLHRLPLLVLAHLSGATVGVESPSASLGASFLLACRSRCSPLAALPLPLLLAIGAGAGLGAAFRSPLLGAVYAIEELSREKGLRLVLPTLLLAGAGTSVNTRLGQPAILDGLHLGPLALELWPWVLLLTVLAAALGCLFVRLLIPLAAWLKLRLQRTPGRSSLGIALMLTLLALLSGGLSLNDGGLLLGPALEGSPSAPPATVLWRLIASLLSIAAGAPGGLMHDTMTLGSLLVGAFQSLPGVPPLPAQALGQLAGVGATALFAGANGTPLFCALFVFTLQGDPELLPLLLLVSAISTALVSRWRSSTWNDSQMEELLSRLHG